MQKDLTNLQQQLEVYEHNGELIEKQELIDKLVDEKIQKTFDDEENGPALLLEGDRLDKINEAVHQQVDSMTPQKMSLQKYKLTIGANKILASLKKTHRQGSDLDSKNVPAATTAGDSILAENKIPTPEMEESAIQLESATSGVEVDDSYENCYGLINPNVEDILSELFVSDSNGETVAAVIASSNLTVDECRKALSTITADSYDDLQRKRFVLYNYRLSCLGVAPRWRGIVRDKHYRTAKEARALGREAYLRDIQAFDLEWLYRRYHGHVVDTTWNSVFDGIFNGAEFNTKQAALIAGMSLKPAQKADYLMLTPDMEKELFMLRSAKTDRFINGLLEKAKKVRVDLLTAARRNRKRGKGLMENLERRVNLWIAANLIPNSSITSTVENYALMTGETLKPSNGTRILKSLDAALIEVDSNYVQG